MFCPLAFRETPLQVSRVYEHDIRMFLEPVESPARLSQHPRVRLFGFELDAIDMAAAVDAIHGWIASGDKSCRFVVTPNVDHSVLCQQHEGLRQAYANASLVLADGMPVVVAAHLLGHPLPGRVAGSDLTAALFQAAERHGGLRVFLLGAAPGVAPRAAARITARWPTVTIVGTDSPPPGFEHDPLENDRILTHIARSGADLLVVGLGAPKQEVWVDAHRGRLAVAAALCVGATIDFLAGDKKRSPLWMRRTGIEWLHRLASEPRRLLGRYARDAWVFPQLVWRQRAEDRRRHAAGG
jgi:N-acetylglucosaminyldiphosphoundecaprenol N-acetyl-beta-D-mannosaminyltransferase